MTKMRSQLKLLAALTAIVVVIVLRGAPSGGHDPAEHPSDWGSQTGSITSTKLIDLLATVKVIKTRPSVPGYDRGCGKSEGCSFGPAWTDDYEGAGGHDGCDTRNNVLQRDLRDLEFRPGTRDCVVVAGTLQDPYTGRMIHFTKTDASAVQIDHLVPLSLAWDMGASEWPLEKRIRFANDIQRNLLAVDGPANASKGDRAPAEWMPINKAFRCDYLGRYLHVALAYDLPITSADHDSIEFGSQACPAPSGAEKTQR